MHPFLLSYLFQPSASSPPSSSPSLRVLLNHILCPRVCYMNLSYYYFFKIIYKSTLVFRKKSILKNSKMQKHPLEV